jgi:hypothetical protein
MGNDRLAITFRCFPLPKQLLTLFDSDKNNNLQVLVKAIERKDISQATQVDFSVEERLFLYWKDIIQALTPNENTIKEINHKIDSSLQFSQSLSTPFGEFTGFDLFSRLLTLGPNGCGPNVLLLSPECRADVVKDLVTQLPKDSQVQLSVFKIFTHYIECRC